MDVTVTVTGDRELITRFKTMPRAINAALYAKVLALSLKLEKKIKVEKLNGQVLNRITGALARSIHSLVDRGADFVIGRVFSSGDVKYAAIHEYGGTTKPHIIVPKKANVLAMANGGFAMRVNHPGSKMPERSYMRSSLHDMSVEISLGMKTAVVAAIQKQVHQ